MRLTPNTKQNIPIAAIGTPITIAKVTRSSNVGDFLTGRGRA